MAAAQEYAENRSITSVVPVDNPLTTNEPELLQMSPEQAEDTQLWASLPSCCPLLQRKGNRGGMPLRTAFCSGCHTRPTET